MNHNSAKSASDSSAEILNSKFKNRPVFTLSELRKAMRASRRTVFRALKHVGYLSSYSHAGKFYTLATIPSFDAHGLWFHRDISFSKHGTLRMTIVVLVKGAPAGRTHEELQAQLQLKVHNTLHDLVRDGLIGREQIDDVYVYVEANAKMAKAQIAKRKVIIAVGPAAQPTDRTLDMACVVEILLVVIRQQKASVTQIRGILGTKNIFVSDREIEQVLDRYGLKKKSKGSLSRRLKT